MAWWRLQSHYGQVRRKSVIRAIRDNPPESGTPAWFARRALLRAAVFDPRDQEFGAPRLAAATSVATGVIQEVRDDAITVDSGNGPEYFGVSSATVTWLGARASPSALRCGDPVVIRYRAQDNDAPARGRAERIWARTGRVTGMIVAADGGEFLVDVRRRDRSPQRVVLASASARQIQVRFPRLAPGYLLDVIGTR